MSTLYSLIAPLLPLLMVAAALSAAVSLRLKGMLRAYRIVAGLFALLLALMAIDHHDYLLFVLAVAIFLVKCLYIPAILDRVLFRHLPSLRAISSFRAASLFAFALLAVAGAGLVAFLLFTRWQIGLHALPIVGLMITAIGLVSVVVRRDVASQLLAFLLLEMGTSIFSESMLAQQGTRYEMGPLLFVAVTATMASYLARQIVRTHGTADTHALRALTE